MAQKWYIVHTYSGFEAKVKAALEDRIRQYGMEDSITEVVVPTEKVVEVVKGERKTSSRKVYPGYILVDPVALQLAASGINGKNLDRIAQEDFVVNDIGRMAVIGRRHTDDRNGFRIEKGSVIQINLRIKIKDSYYMVR